MAFTKKQVALPLILIFTLFFGISFYSTVSADTEKAKEAFNSALEYEKNNDKLAATAAYKLCLKEDPNYIDAYLNLGSIHFKDRQYDLALEMFKSATEKDTKNVDAYANLGKVQYILKRYAEAEVSFKTAIDIAPSASLHKELGKVYYKKKNYKEVIDAFTKCHEMNGGDYTTYYMVGKAHQKLGDNTKAISSLKQSIKTKNNYLSHSTIGQIYLSQEKYTQAASSFKSALKVSPKKYQAAYNYAIAIENNAPEDYAVNIKNWESFIRIAKNNPKANKDVNVAKSHVKDLKEAMEKADLQ